MRNRRLLNVLAGICVTAATMATAAAATVPRQSPEFSIDLTTGKKILLSQYKGKVSALAFILTTCSHCQKAVGTLSTMQKEFGARGFQALASAIDDMGAMNVPDFVKRFQPPFPVGFNSRDPVLAYLQHPVMLRLLMPQLVFIDRSGTIRAQYAGDDKFFVGDQEKHMRDQIESLLKEAPASAKKPAKKNTKKKL